jgi:dienelactone hydrolase
MQSIKTLGLLFVAGALTVSSTGCGGSSSTSTRVATSVGRAFVPLTDSSRTELFGGVSGRRRIGAYIWYPATPATGARPGNMFSDAVADALSAATTIPKSVFLSLPNNSFLDSSAPKSATRYPVLVMSAGDGSSALNHTSTAEYLAGRGYIVVGVNHTFNAIISAFSDTDILPGDIAATATGVGPELNETSGFAPRDQNWKNVVALDKYFAADMNYVISQLPELDRAHPILKGRFALDKIGAFGHSFGGSHSFRLLRENPQVRAAANVDGTVFNDDFSEGARKPFMFVSSPRPTDAEFESVRPLLAGIGLTEAEIDIVMNRLKSDTIAFQKTPSAVRVDMKKAEHNNFSDAALWTAFGIPSTDVSKTTPAKALLETYHRYLIAFFDEKLKGVYSDLIHKPSGDANVVVTNIP